MLFFVTNDFGDFGDFSYFSTKRCAMAVDNCLFLLRFFCPVSLPKHTFTRQAQSSKQLTSIVHMLLPEFLSPWSKLYLYNICLFVCVEVLRPSQPNGVMSSAVSLPNHTFTGQA